MKHLLLLILAALLISPVLQAQQFEVTYSKFNEVDRHGKTLIRKVENQCNVIQKQMDTYKRNQEINLDTIYYEQAINLYTKKLTKLRDDFINYFAIQKKVKVFKIDTQYYINNDTLGLSLSERILVIQNRLTRHETKYGKEILSTNEKYIEYKNTLTMLLDFEQQLANQ